MQSIMPVLLALAMLATLAVLAFGVISFAFDTKANQHATKWMTARVILQGLALAIFALMVLLNIVD